jgi:hypothetical protein
MPVLLVVVGMSLRRVDKFAMKLSGYLTEESCLVELAIEHIMSHLSSSPPADVTTPIPCTQQLNSTARMHETECHA